MGSPTGEANPTPPSTMSGGEGPRSPETPPQTATEERAEAPQKDVDKIEALCGYGQPQVATEALGEEEVPYNYPQFANAETCHEDQLMLNDGNRELQLAHMRKRVQKEGLQIGRIVDHHRVNDKVLEFKTLQQNGKAVWVRDCDTT